MLIPEWWSKWFPRTYVEFKPMKDSFEIQVFFDRDGQKMRFDYEYTVENLDSLDYETMFRDVAVRMLVNTIGLDTASSV